MKKLWSRFRRYLRKAFPPKMAHYALIGIIGELAALRLIPLPEEAQAREVFVNGCMAVLGIAILAEVLLMLRLKRKGLPWRYGFSWCFLGVLATGLVCGPLGLISWRMSLFTGALGVLLLWLETGTFPEEAP